MLAQRNAARATTRAHCTSRADACTSSSSRPLSVAGLHRLPPLPTYTHCTGSPAHSLACLHYFLLRAVMSSRAWDASQASARASTKPCIIPCRDRTAGQPTSQRGLHKVGFGDIYSSGPGRPSCMSCIRMCTAHSRCAGPDTAAAPVTHTRLSQQANAKCGCKAQGDVGHGVGALRAVGC